MSETLREVKRSLAINILSIFLLFAIVFICLDFSGKRVLDDEKKVAVKKSAVVPDNSNYIKKIKENLFEGVVRGVVYQPDDDEKMVKVDLTFQNVAVLRQFKELNVWGMKSFCLLVETKDKKFIHLSVDFSNFYVFKERQKIFLNKFDVPKKGIFYATIIPGERIRIPSSKPLKNFDDILVQFIYLGDEKIPFIDE